MGEIIQKVYATGNLKLPHLPRGGYWFITGLPVFADPIYIICLVMRVTKSQRKTCRLYSGMKTQALWPWPVMV